MIITYNKYVYGVDFDCFIESTLHVVDMLPPVKVSNLNLDKQLMSTLVPGDEGVFAAQHVVTVAHSLWLQNMRGFQLPSANAAAEVIIVHHLYILTELSLQET